MQQPTTTKPSPKSIARDFLDAATAAGFDVSVRPGLVTIRKSFTPGDRNAYVACDMDGPGLLAMLPATAPGSVWGTDGASVGGHAGLTNGSYRLNKSGVAKRVTTALATYLR